MPEAVNSDTVSGMMMRTGKQTYRSQIRSLWIWALLVAVLMAVIVPGAQAALSENRIRAYHNFFADRTGLEPDLNAELHWVYGNFYDDFAPGSLVAPKKPIVIGENMKRVQQYADEIGGHAYRPWKNDPFDFDLGMKRNKRWIQDMKREGREIIDIGPDFKRRSLGRDPSDFYNMERNQLKGYDNYKKVFERTGKTSGGVPGLDF